MKKPFTSHHETEIPADSADPEADFLDEEALVEALGGEADEADPHAAEIAALKDEAADLKDRLLRMAAEMDNLRKRAEREKAEATLYAASNFARDLLGVADSMERALAAVPASERDAASDSLKNLLTGIELTDRELLNVFQRHNIRRLDAVGQKFDPNYHQAMFEVPTSEQPPGTVVQEIQKGYVVGERVLRPAMVGVAKPA
jgi:molecular chaperone GrpE